MKTQKQQKQTVKKHSFWEKLYAVSILLGVLAIGYEIPIFRHTMISVYIPISIILSVGFLAYYFNKQHYKKVCSVDGNFLPFLQNVVSWGFMACYLFMAANFYFADQTITRYKFSIKEKISMRGSRGYYTQRKPLVTIDYFNFEKVLVFQNEDTAKVNSADSVNISVRKGWLGFDVIEAYGVIPVLEGSGESK